MNKPLVSAFVFLLLFCLVVSAFPQAQAATLESGLVLHYDVDEGSGTTLTDLSSYGNDGAISGASWTAGRYYYGLRFDGINDKVEISHSSSLNIASSYSIVAWIKPSVLGGYRTITWKGEGESVAFRFSTVDNDIIFVPSGTGGGHTTSGLALTTNIWYFVTAIFNDANDIVKIYVDGVEKYSGAETSSALTNEGILRIGIQMAEGYNPFNGVIDEVRVYNRALTPTEITELYYYNPYIVPEVPFNENISYYLTDDLHTVLGATGYALSETAPDSYACTTISKAGETVSWGWRIYLQHETTTEELTVGEPEAIVTRSSGSGYQSNTFTISERRIHFGYSALKLALYARWDNDAWGAPKQVFISDVLYYKEFLDATWTFQLYTDLNETYSTMRYGNSSYISGATGILYQQPSTFDWMTYKLGQGQLISFMVFPYVALMGNLFYAIMMFVVCMTIYIRYRNTSIILVSLIIFGGAGGIFNVFVGDAVMGVVWLLATFALAALLYKVWR